MIDLLNDDDEDGDNVGGGYMISDLISNLSTISLVEMMRKSCWNNHFGKTNRLSGHRLLGHVFPKHQIKTLTFVK